MSILTRDFRFAVLSIADLFAAVYEFARCRAAGSPSPTKRSLADRDETAWNLHLQERETAIHRRTRESISPEKRPDYSPTDRREILLLQHLRGWSQTETARRFVLHPNTISRWEKTYRTNPEARLFSSTVAWNKISDGVRWLVHEIRTLCPEPEFGSRSIASEIVRAGVKISRTSVRRFLRKERPPAPPKPADAPEIADVPTVPTGLLRPCEINQVWHLDFLTLDFFLFRFYIAVILDGFSRKILALRAFPDAPRTAHVLHLLRATIKSFGVPKHLITDHGCQFRARFKKAIRSKWSIDLVKGRTASFHTNGKAERFFKTLRIRLRFGPFFPSERSIQKHLDRYREWHNRYRPMMILSGRTPEEAWENAPVPVATPILECDPAKSAFAVERVHFDNDPHLPVLHITIVREAKKAA